MHENKPPNVFSNLSRLFKNIVNKPAQVRALPLKRNNAHARTYAHTHTHHVHLTPEGSLGRGASAPETDSFTQPHFNSHLCSRSIAGQFGEVFLLQGESLGAYFGV